MPPAKRKAALLAVQRYQFDEDSDLSEESEPEPKPKKRNRKGEPKKRVVKPPPPVKVAKTDDASEDTDGDENGTNGAGSVAAIPAADWNKLDPNRGKIKISSWNVNGVRAWLKKDGISYIKQSNCDILCLQEVKCDDSKLPKELDVPGFERHVISGEQEGYAGVALLTRVKPIAVTFGIGDAKLDEDGRVITAEFDDFYLINTYVPNAGRGLKRLDYRLEWDRAFHAYLQKLDAKKPLIWCGDLNVAHAPVDLANPKTNAKTAGFTKEERDSFAEALAAGFVDSFRHFYPEVKDAYSFWSSMRQSRDKNVGWRLDYFVVSKRFVAQLEDSVIHSHVTGSDHCPVQLILK